jgi:acid stress-induced BolA-like protein IbaG/YrbA
VESSPEEACPEAAPKEESALDAVSQQENFMSIIEQMTTAIEEKLPGATVNVSGGGGHFEIHVVSEQFAGKRIVQKQRLVYSAIRHLMGGDNAPVHAIDRMVCEVP